MDTSSSALPTNDIELSELGSSSISDSETGPPDGGYGWICVGCSFVVHFFALGIESSWGVYQSYYFMSQDVGAVSNSDLAWVGSIQATGQPLVGFVAGILAQRIRFRVTRFIGTCIMCLALIIASFSTQAWHLYLTQGLCLYRPYGYSIHPVIS
ncbi:hypothetical protein DFS33DRAFT_913384 [Desarmillaria ectypa]|nr:hypothetical protein DFS33DRAFT_913384 [Desarmillaria ectypa]